MSRTLSVNTTMERREVPSSSLTYAGSLCTQYGPLCSMTVLWKHIVTELWSSVATASHVDYTPEYLHILQTTLKSEASKVRSANQRTNLTLGCYLQLFETWDCAHVLGVLWRSTAFAILANPLICQHGQSMPELTTMLFNGRSRLRASSSTTKAMWLTVRQLRGTLRRSRLYQPK